MFIFTIYDTRVSTPGGGGVVAPLYGLHRVCQWIAAYGFISLCPKQGI